MRALILSFVASTLVPASAVAQRLDVTAAGGAVASSVPAAPVAIATPASPSPGPVDATAAAVPPDSRPPVAASPQPRRRTDSRRRPSMVGYIEDGTIASQVRIRFDAAFRNEAPDRAEFFYAKCGCYRGLPPGHPAFDPNAPGPGPGVLTSLDFRQLFVQGEVAVHRRISLFAEAPVRWIEPKAFAPGTGAFGNQSGVGDATIGGKLLLAAGERSALTVQVRAFLPTGDALKGLGTHHATVEPMLLFGQAVTERLGFESQLGLWHPIGGSAGVPTAGGGRFSGNVLIYGFGPSYDLVHTAGVRFAPVIEIVGWRVLDGLQTAGPNAGATSWNIVNLKAGVRLAVAGRHSMYAGYGLALTSDDWYDRILRLEYRLGF